MGVEDNISWHKQYKDSAYIFIGNNNLYPDIYQLGITFLQTFIHLYMWFISGGLPYDLTEGDILCVFSQYVCFFQI